MTSLCESNTSQRVMQELSPNTKLDLWDIYFFFYKCFIFCVSDKKFLQKWLHNKTPLVSCSVDGASAWDTIQLVRLFVWFNKYGKKLVKKTAEINPSMKRLGKNKTKHYWSFSHDPATVVTDVLLVASSLSASFSWILAALYQDIVIIKGFSSSRLFNRFESI